MQHSTAIFEDTARRIQRAKEAGEGAEEARRTREEIQRGGQR